MKFNLPAAGAASVLAFCSLSGCAPERIIPIEGEGDRTGSAPTDLPVDEEPAPPGEPPDEPDEPDEPDGPDEPDEPTEFLQMTIRFRNPGAHVIINAQAGDVNGALFLATAPSVEVPQPFVLNDQAESGALLARAREEIVIEQTQVSVLLSASTAFDGASHVVGQAGPLPVEVCAILPEGASGARITLTCDGTLGASLDGTAVLMAAEPTAGDVFCRGMTFLGDTTTFPWQPPSTSVQVASGQNGEACWPLDLLAGANESGSDNPGTADADGTFTFTATAL